MDEDDDDDDDDDADDDDDDDDDPNVDGSYLTLLHLAAWPNAPSHHDFRFYVMVISPGNSP